MLTRSESLFFIHSLPHGLTTVYLFKSGGKQRHRKAERQRKESKNEENTEIRRCEAYKGNRLVYIYIQLFAFSTIFFFFSLLFFYYRAILSSGIVSRGSTSLNDNAPLEYKYRSRVFSCDFFFFYTNPWFFWFFFISVDSSRVLSFDATVYHLPL